MSHIAERLPSPERQRRLIAGFALLAIVSIAIAGISGHSQVAGCIATVGLVGSLASSFLSPVFGVGSFVAIFVAAAFVPSALGAIDTMMAPLAVAPLAAARPARWAVLASLLLIVAGLWEPSSLTFTLRFEVVAVWSFQYPLAVLMGWGIQQRRRIRDELAERYQARRRELARTLHDSVAASLTSVIIRSEVMAMAHQDSDKNGEIAGECQQIAEASRVSMRQLRQLITLLDTEKDDTLVTRLESLKETVDATRDTLEEHGFSVDCPRTTPSILLNSGQEILINRFLRETTTNILKYGEPGSTVEVIHDYSSAQLNLIVLNEVRRGNDRAPEMSSGIGIAALKETAQALGATITSGQCDDERWKTELLISV